MARTKEQKKEIVSKLKTIMDEAKTLVFVNIHGLKVSDATKIRRELKKDNVGLFVAKKTLTTLALAHKKYSGNAPEMIGEFALVYGNDQIAPARDIYEFQKKIKDQISIIGGVFEGYYKTKEEMIEIASIPTRQTLYGMLVNVINSPIQGLVMALDQIAKK